MNPFSRRTLGSMLLAPAAAWLTPRLSAQGCAPPPGGQPVNFTHVAGLQNVTRKAISTLTPAEVTRLRLAYSRLRDLNTSDAADPRGHMQQANVHCWQCGGSGMDIHQSWSFLPWHRCYLYFHERILCKLLNDNSFRLPFWDWDTVAGRSLPAVYRPATVGPTPNSIFDAKRSAAASGGSPMPGAIFPAASNPMNAANFAAFGGSAGSGGGLENGPHGAIHVWTGGSGDMGSLATAARDPVFFAHHCQIDRLWSEWVRRNPVAHANPTAAAFLSRSFLFFDENKKWTRIKISDVVTTPSLGYSYLPGAAMAKPAPATWIELTVDTSSGAIKFPADFNANPPANALVRKRALIVEDAVLPNQTGIYNIFLGDPPATGADQAVAPNYVGYMGIILGEHVHEGKSTLVLNANQQFMQQAAGPGAVLTFAEAGTTQATKLTFTNVYLTEE